MPLSYYDQDTIINTVFCYDTALRTREILLSLDSLQSPEVNCTSNDSVGEYPPTNCDGSDMRV